MKALKFLNEKSTFPPSLWHSVDIQMDLRHYGLPDNQEKIIDYVVLAAI